MIVKFTETDFIIGDGDSIKNEKEEEVLVSENILLGRKYFEGLPLFSTNSNEVFKVAKQMPRFFSSECEDLEGDNTMKEACAQKKMYEFIFQNFKYPAIARENGVEGTVVVQFIIETDGTLSNFKITRDIGGLCGKEALRNVASMNDDNIWIPGMQRGQLIRTYYNLPIQFRLE